MKKKTIILIVVGCILLYICPFALIFGFATVESTHMKFEKVNETYEINKGKLVLSELDSFYDADDETFYITGNLKNTTKKDLDSVSLSFLIYDEDDNLLGQGDAYLEKLAKNKTWRLKAVYSDIDASEATTFELETVDYY